MAEALAGLGVAASVIAVIQIAEDVIKLCAEYASSVKDAQSDMQDICTECESVQSVLKRLHGMCTNARFRRQMPTLQLLIGEDGPLSQYQYQLKNLNAELRLPKGWKGSAEILKWPMKAKRFEKSLRIMERKKALLTLAISMDSASLSTVLAADLDDAAKSLEVISDNVTAMSDNVATVVNATDAIIYDNLYKDIIRWLSPPDPASNHNEACRKRHPETGKWLLESDTLQRWKNQPASLLWLHGIPGSGKSILWYLTSFQDYQLLRSIFSSSIIEYISGCCAGMPSVAVAYFYFDFSDVEKRKPQNFLRSLIIQLLTSVASVPECIAIPYKKHRDGRQPSTNQLLAMLRSLVEPYLDSYFFWDAFDECADWEELLRITAEIVDWKLPSLHIVITSRKEQQLSDSLDLIVTEQKSIQGSFVDSDISNYVRGRLQDDSRFRKWSASIQREIAEALVKGAEGMFRWAACQLDTLSACRKLDQVRAALRTLPKDLDETYHRILSKINPEDERDVKIVLQWLAFSARPVQLNEVAEALAIEYSDPPRFNPQQRLPEPLDILTMCSSLVTISEPSYNDVSYSHLSHKTQGHGDRHANILCQELKLAHYSVKEYLISDRIWKSQIPVPDYGLLERSAHRVIAETCLIYLLHFEGDPLTLNTLKSFPLARYAARNWPLHAHFGNDVILPGLQPLLLRLFRVNSKPFSNWIKIGSTSLNETGFSVTAPRRRKPRKSTIMSTIPGPLYFSSELGLLEVVKHLADSGADVNAQAGLYGNALQAAAVQKNEAIVEALLERGADVNARGGSYGNALQAAVRHQSEAIVRVLLEKGADVNTRDERYGSALHAATRNGAESIVRLLLERGADVNARGGQDELVLQAAALGYSFNEVILRVLLENGADVNAQGGSFGNALQAAAYRNHHAMVRILLEKGADVNASGGEYGSALQAATIQKNDAIVRVLLEKGADVNAQGGLFGNALQAAAYGNHDAMVRLLLEKGADVNARGGEYGSALQAATIQKNEAIVRVLLERGADVNVSSEKYGNALHVATRNGAESLVRLLLESGADVNEQGGPYGNALHVATLSGAENIVRLLLESGADVNAIGGEYGNALQAAVWKKNEAMVKVLLEKGADVNAPARKHGNALYAAIRGNNVAILRVLLDKGADVNAKSGGYEHPILEAALWGNEATVRVLLEKGANVNAKGDRYRSALRAACYRKNQSIVRLLLDSGADESL